MLNQQTIEKLYAMRMRGMAEAFTQQQEDPGSAQLGFEERFALLVDRQWNWRQNRALERRLRAYVKPRLVLVDELGYLAYDNRAADLLFQVINRRYERGSLLVTTNLAFKDWGTVFPNAACVTAMLDRLTHHAEILTLTGESYRRREAEATQKARRAKA